MLVLVYVLTEATLAILGYYWPHLDEALFSPPNKIEDLKRWEVRNFTSDIGAKMRSFYCWRICGKLLYAVGLSLSKDNRTISKSELLVRGKLPKKINIRASKIWPGANKNVVLSLKVKTESFSNFKSTNKNLESDIIDQDEIPHTFTRRNKKESISIPRSCQKDHDLGTFCVRFKACYTLGLIDENLEYSIELFPASKEAVLAQGSSQSGWLRVYSGEFSPWEQQPWDPCIPWSPPPFILSGTPFCHAPRAPPMEEIRKEMKKMLWPSYGTEDQPEQGEWAIHIPS